MSTDAHSMTNVFAFAALLVAACVGLGGLWLTRLSLKSARESTALQELRAIYEASTQQFRLQIIALQAEVLRHQQHVALCEEALNALREELQRHRQGGDGEQHVRT